MYHLDRADDFVRLVRSAHDTRASAFWSVARDGALVGLFGLNRYVGGAAVSTTTYLDADVRGTGLNAHIKALARGAAHHADIQLVASVAQDNARSNAAMRHLAEGVPQEVSEPWAERTANLYIFPGAPTGSAWPPAAVGVVADLVAMVAAPAVLSA